MTRSRSLVDLSSYTARTMNLHAIGVAALLAMIVLVMWSSPNDDPVAPVQRGLRISAVLLALSACFLFEDVAHDTTDHLPQRIRARRVIRLAIAAPILTTVWGVLAAVSAARIAPGESSVSPPILPLARHSLEFIALIAVALALAALASRLFGQWLGGSVAAGVFLALVALAVFLPQRYAVFVDQPDHPSWVRAGSVWWLVFWGALALSMILSRDPGSGRVRARPAARRARRARKPIPARAR